MRLAMSGHQDVEGRCMRMEIAIYELEGNWRWGMAVACLPALTSRYLVVGKFAVTKNLSNASQICRIRSPSKRSACGQWNVRVLPQIPHFETPSPAPALSYPWIKTTKLQPSVRFLRHCMQVGREVEQAKKAASARAVNVVLGTIYEFLTMRCGWQLFRFCRHQQVLRMLSECLGVGARHVKPDMLLANREGN